VLKTIPETVVLVTATDGIIGSSVLSFLQELVIAAIPISTTAKMLNKFFILNYFFIKFLKKI
jgi:hypothetical protein